MWGGGGNESRCRRRCGERAKRTLNTLEAGKHIGIFTILGHSILMPHDAFSAFSQNYGLKQRFTIKDSKYYFTSYHVPISSFSEQRKTAAVYFNL